MLMSDLCNSHKKIVIHKDKIDKKDNIKNENNILRQESGKSEFLDKENILNVRNLNFKQDKRTKYSTNNIYQNDCHKLIPLNDLDINKYPGYINFGFFNGEKKEFITSKNIKLVDRYEPSNYKNDFNSNHKYLDIPSYLTPTKRSTQKNYLYRSQICHDKKLKKKSDSCELFNQKMAVETKNKDLSMNYKSELLSNKHEFDQNFSNRKRSFSLGKNNTKLDLIKKNNFIILGNY